MAEECQVRPLFSIYLPGLHIFFQMYRQNMVLTEQKCDKKRKRSGWKIPRPCRRGDVGARLKVRGQADRTCVSIANPSLHNWILHCNPRSEDLLLLDLTQT